MRRKCFFKNTFAVSVMYDAVLFVVMVSLSGVVLIPALQNDIAVESSIKKHQEHTADEALNSLLVSRVDKFDYNLLGRALNYVVGDFFENNDIYNSLSSWLLGHEQLHKTYANLIADDLGCQFNLKISTIASTSFNLFTGELDSNLRDNIDSFLSEYLGDKYGFKFTAVWYPVKEKISDGRLGGELIAGDEPPDEDCFVSQCFIVMPYNSTQSFIDALYSIPGVDALEFEEISINRAEVRLVIWEIRG